jgi:hypothetical protein
MHVLVRLVHVGGRGVSVKWKDFLFLNCIRIVVTVYNLWRASPPTHPQFQKRKNKILKLNRKNIFKMHLNDKKILYSTDQDFDLKGFIKNLMIIHWSLLFFHWSLWILESLSFLYWNPYLFSLQFLNIS